MYMIVQNYVNLSELIIWQLINLVMQTTHTQTHVHVHVHVSRINIPQQL